MTPAQFQLWRIRQHMSLTDVMRAMDITAQNARAYETGFIVNGSTAEVEIPKTIALSCAAIESFPTVLSVLRLLNEMPPPPGVKGNKDAEAGFNAHRNLAGLCLKKIEMDQELRGGI